jgi:mannose-6-phosphate isomerase-like protein (cupin superfamily)
MIDPGRCVLTPYNNLHRFRDLSGRAPPLPARSLCARFAFAASCKPISLREEEPAVAGSHYKDYEQILALDERQLAHVSVFVEHRLGTKSWLTS